MAFPHCRRHLPVQRTQLHSKEHAMRAWEGNKGGRSLGRASIATVLGTRPQQVLIDKDVWSVLKARRLCDVCSPPSV